MLDNLTPISFSGYGHVVLGGLDTAMKNLGFYFIKQRDIYEKQVEGLYINKDNFTIIDIFEGTAVLYIGDTPNSLCTFLLDKTIVISKNVYFYVAPLLNRATISISTNGKWPDYIVIPKAQRPIGINPNININHIYTLLYHEKELGFHFKGEQHNFWEITYVDKGNMYNVTGDHIKTEFNLKQGNIMLFTPNQWHSQYADENVSVCYITIGFEMDYANTEILENCVFESDAEIKKLLEKIVMENENQNIYSNDLILCYLKEIIVHLIRSKKFETILKKADTASKSYIENDITVYVREYIKKNIHNKLSVSDIAKSIPINSSYLSTLFKHNTGITLIEYIGRQKLDKAKDYIRSGRYTFTQISEMLSFNSVHYFSKLFKKQFGITPSEYSNAVKK